MIDFCSATRFSLVQGIKHPLSNKVFIGLECKMKSFNLLSNKVFIGLERKMKSFNLLSNKVLIVSMVQGIQLDLSNKVLIGSRSTFAHAAQNRIFILLCSFFPYFADVIKWRYVFTLINIYSPRFFVSCKVSR